MKEMPLLSENSVSKVKLDNFLKERSQRHSHYRNYCKLDYIISNVYDSNSIFLSDGTGWNDEIDSKYFLSQSKEGKKLYGLCLSHDPDESVAMWMLYGKDEHGGMIDFTYSDIKKIIKLNKDEEVEIGNFVDGKWNKSKNVKLRDVYTKDVLYCSENKDGSNCKVVHDNERKSSLNKEICAGANPAMKHVPWSYEKETRLIAEAEINDNKNHYLKLKLPEQVKNKIHSRIYCSPKDIDNKNKNEAEAKIDDYINESKIKNEINWDLSK